LVEQKHVGVLEANIAEENLASRKVMEKMSSRVSDEWVEEYGWMCYYLDRPVKE